MQNKNDFSFQIRTLKIFKLFWRDSKVFSLIFFSFKLVFIFQLKLLQFFSFHNKVFFGAGVFIIELDEYRNLTWFGWVFKWSFFLNIIQKKILLIKFGLRWLYISVRYEIVSLISPVVRFLIFHFHVEWGHTAQSAWHLLSPSHTMDCLYRSLFDERAFSRWKSELDDRPFPFHDSWFTIFCYN